MGYREVGLLEIKEVLRLWLAGRGKKPIARQLGRGLAPLHPGYDPAASRSGASGTTWARRRAAGARAPEAAQPLQPPPVAGGDVGVHADAPHPGAARGDGVERGVRRRGSAAPPVPRTAPGGAPSCTATCTLSNTTCTGCAVCDYGVRVTGEVCDGSDLGGQSCQSQGFDSGTVLCQSSCQGFNIPISPPSNVTGLQRTDKKDRQEARALLPGAAALAYKN